DQLPLVVRLGRPESGEAEGAAVLEAEVDRELLAVRADLPLVETVSHDQTAVLPDQRPERWLLQQRLGASVDQPVRDPLVLRPVRKESPAGHICFGLAFALSNDQSLLGRR